MGLDPVNKWASAKNTSDLEAFWHGAAKWAGYKLAIDLSLLQFRNILDSARAHRSPPAYRAAMHIRARNEAFKVWGRLRQEGLLELGGEVTALGIEVAHELRKAARLYRGFGRNRSERPAVSEVSPTTVRYIDERDAHERLILPSGDGVEFDPGAENEGWADVMGGGGSDAAR